MADATLLVAPRRQDHPRAGRPLGRGAGQGRPPPGRRRPEHGDPRPRRLQLRVRLLLHGEGTSDQAAGTRRRRGAGRQVLAGRRRRRVARPAHRRRRDRRPVPFGNAPAEDTVRDAPATAAAPTEAVRQPVAKDEPTVDAFPAADTVRAEAPAVAERPVEHAPAEEQRVDDSSVAHDADTVETLVAAEPQPTIPEVPPDDPRSTRRGRHDRAADLRRTAAGGRGSGEPSGREQSGGQDSVTTDPALELSQPFPTGEAIDGEQDVWSPPVPPTLPRHERQLRERGRRARRAQRQRRPRAGRRAGLPPVLSDTARRSAGP